MPIEHLDLYDDVPRMREAQEILEPPPVLVVPLVQIELAVHPLVGEDVALVAVAHHVADVVAADRLQQVEMALQPDGMVEQIVLPGPAQQQYGFALVLPVIRILGIRADASVGRRDQQQKKHCRRTPSQATLS